MYGRLMDTAPSPSSHSGPRPKRRFVFVAIGAVWGATCVYGLVALQGPANATALAIGLLAGLAVARFGRPLPSAAEAGAPIVPNDAAACLGDHPELLAAYDSFTHALKGLASQNDPILRETASVRLATVQEELRNLARGRIVFPATEAWRTVYEQILRSPDIRCYRSVAWLRNEDYWQDVPGRQSMQVNYDLLQQGVPIERILILCDYFWPVAAVRPAPDICRWIDRQYTRGMWIGLIRESALDSELDLLCDFGIYGSRATGLLELDEQCRTTRFTFDFSPDGLRLTEARWKRLFMYAVSYADLLDRTSRGS